MGVMNLSEKQQTFAHNVGLLISYICFMGYKVTLGEAFRTQEQADIYAKEGKGITHSLHIKRLAIDLNIFDHVGNLLTTVDDLSAFGKYWEKINPDNRWGGNFKTRPDSDHFEMQDLDK